MADSKLTALTEETAPVDADLLYLVDDVAGTPTSKKITWANIKAAIRSALVSDTAYGSGWNGDTTTAPSKNAVYDKIETLDAASTFVTRAYQGLTSKSTWSAANTREQWGTEEATVDDATLPALTSVTVYASIRGHVNTWTSNSLLRLRVEISLDGGATWSQGEDNWMRDDSLSSVDRIHLFCDHQVTGTVTGDIQARVMAETDIISPALGLANGRIAMEVLV
jgi:hypothetical protein